MAEEQNQNSSVNTNQSPAGGLPDDLQVPVNSPAPQFVPRKDVGNQLLSKAAPALPIDNSLNVPTTKPMRPRRGRRWLNWVIGAVVLALLAGTAYVVLPLLDFQRGTLALTFDPGNVRVTIDNKFQKDSVNSLTIKLKAGSHNLLVAKDGYVDFEQDIDLTSKEIITLTVVLHAVPTIEKLIDEPVSWPSITNNGRALAFVNAAGGFEVLEIATLTRAPLFKGNFINLKKVVWSTVESNALVRLIGQLRLPNAIDNSNVRGRFIPLGERPAQGALQDNGISAWSFKSTQINAIGWQPILLNGNVRDLSFSPEGDNIIYFYETANGEKSVVLAQADGTEWERLQSGLNFNDPTLTWLNNDRYVLWADDTVGTDKIFDLVEKEFMEIMPDRVKQTFWSNSPEGNRIAYWANVGGMQQLSIWNIAEQKVEKVFDRPISTFTWRSEDQLIVGLPDGSLWRWYLDGKERPIQFLSAVGQMQINKLLFSAVINKLFIISSDNKVLSLDLIV
ncbi:MAG: PEGA domain-containing protein [Patescibacteria group bacterium]|jgi:WD40 repeat protein